MFLSRAIADQPPHQTGKRLFSWSERTTKQTSMANAVNGSFLMIPSDVWTVRRQKPHHGLNKRWAQDARRQNCKSAFERKRLPGRQDISSDSMILRPGIQALLEDARRGMFEIVAAEALDRVIRDQAACWRAAHAARQSSRSRCTCQAHTPPSSGSFPPFPPSPALFFPQRAPEIVRQRLGEIADRRAFAGPQRHLDRHARRQG